MKKTDTTTTAEREPENPRISGLDKQIGKTMRAAIREAQSRQQPQPAPEQGEHSPLPWQAVLNHASVSEFTELEDSNGKEIGYLYKLGALEKVSNANAKLIVRAVNNLDALADALRDCITEQGALAERSHEYALRRLSGINDVVMAALANLEGGKQ